MDNKSKLNNDKERNWRTILTIIQEHYSLRQRKPRS
jgi:hypothetical protein